MTEPKEKLERLRARRGGHRGVCTKLEKEAIELTQTPEHDKIERCEVIAKQLEAKIKILNEIDEEILNICDVKEIQNEIEESAEVSDRILETIRIIEKHTKTAPKGQGHIHTNAKVSVVDSSLNSTVDEEQQNIEGTIENSSNSATTSSGNVENTSIDTNIVNNSPTSTGQAAANTTTISSSPANLPKLPKLQLPKFGGRVTEWSSFWDSYDSAIHSNPNISKVNKLQSLLEGNAARAIKGLTLTSANYDSAVNILQDRFGKVQQTIAAHMDEILKIQACTSGRTGQLRYVYDKISVHVRGLASLGISSEQYGSMLIPIIMSKLTNEIRIEIARKATGEVWKIDDLLNTIKIEIEAREVSEGVQSNPQQSRKPGGTPTVGAFVTKGNNSDKFHIRCVYCEEPHYSASCAKVVGSEARKVILRDTKRCFNCLRKGHCVKVCQTTKACRYCGGKHHQSICSKNQPVTKEDKGKSPEGAGPQCKPDGETENDFCGTATLTRLAKGSVLLQTARAIATNGSKSIPVRILFDTGSQRSYVTNAVTKQLKLNPVKRETLHLNTFGNSKSKRQNCELFKFSIRSKKGEDNIELRAINFPTICSPVNSKINVENYPHLN